MTTTSLITLERESAAKDATIARLREALEFSCIDNEAYLEHLKTRPLHETEMGVMRQAAADGLQQRITSYRATLNQE